MKTIIKLEDVVWTRQGKDILKNMNWTIKEGEQWAILGLNGSGKTSILNIVTGYSFPTSGKVTVLDSIFGETNIPKLRERIGFVSSALDKFGSTFNKQRVKNIILGGKYSAIGLFSNMEITEADRQLADQLLRDLRIDYLKDKRYITLSQGEKRRVLIARALMAEPDLLILDEPCSGLDLLAREEVLEIIEEIPKNNCHLLYVTHYIEEITEAITHVLLINNGKVVKAGPKKEVLTNELLSETYTIPVNIHWENNRPWVTIQSKDIENI